ncbi:PAS domain-containing sensor histidine kinase [Rheinheimera sp. 1928-s]|uniref:sensor histidine kinase n=1 Tax=Rheinheimera sp. 1928-s TaxID=3033803 RepID=UPI00260263DD|nr:PAS domain-containing sensor histidine kinase [Rheinheimera sp. 1928-s]MDF3125072.1 ATP-binding protein [Rheinheimera sp. 1928-s]
MSQSQSASTTELQQKLSEIRHQFTNSLWRSFALIALVAVPLSILRSFNTGWLPVYTVHIAVGMLLLSGAWLCNRMSLRLKGGLLILVFWAVGLPGALTFGFASPGVWWLVLSCLVAHVLYQAKVALFLALATFLSMIGTAFGFMSGYLSIPVSINRYVTDSASWATYIIVNCIVFFVVVRTFISYTASLQATTQHQFRQWIDDLPMGVVVLGKDQQPYYNNRAAKELLGPKPEQPLAFMAGTSKLYPAEQMPAARALAGETSQTEDMEIEQDGIRRHMQAWGRPGYNEHGELTFGIAVYEDISARKQLDLLKNRFVSTVSHELRTPLTSIHGALGLILGNALGEPEPKIRAMLKLAEQNSQRLIRLINDILDMQKIEAGQMNFHFAKVQLQPLLHCAVEQMASYAEQHQVTIELGAVPDDVWLWADSNRLMQVLANLLSNAAKFSFANTTVKVQVQQQDRQVRIAIIDQGQGIDEEFKAFIFRPFSQSDTSDVRNFGGTGLGLSISKSIIEQHGGTLSFDSTTGQGSSFYIDLKLGSEHIS